MKFKISSRLKNIIGKDLITDDFVAIFELVKNSFDAYANRVDLYFGEDEIYIVDDGKGMSKSDIENKWLFVAFSGKSDLTEDVGLRKDYRSGLRSKRGRFAGNKGVGRFSCDRLGAKLSIQSSTREKSRVSHLEMDWNDFEIDQSKQFGEVELSYKAINAFDSPDKLKQRVKTLKSGTILKISELRNHQSWDRDKLVKLKSALAKLIDPFGVKDDFEVWIHSPSNLESDATALEKWHKKRKVESAIEGDSPYFDQVNGRVNNLIFEKLGLKTTTLSCTLSQDGLSLYTDLSDRGELVYRIKEKNPFEFLKGESVEISLFYMNTVAKTNFTRQMGVDNINFGSIFLFNNGFRVFPVGEPRDDTFKLDARKAQGYNRYLGTRELLGKIEIDGSPEKFKETSSRDSGLTRTPAYLDVENFLMQCIKRLEAYVVEVSWKDKLDAEVDDLSRVLTDQGKGRVAKVLANLVRGKGIELLDYSQNLLDVVSERTDSFESTIKSLQLFVDRSGRNELQKKIDIAINRFEELKEAEEIAEAKAEKERQARISAESETKKAQAEALKQKEEKELIKRELDEEKAQTLFYKKVSSVDLETILSFHHQIGIYSSNVKQLIEVKLDKLNHGDNFSKEDFASALESISFINQQILTVSRIATVADFRLSSEEIETDICEFCESYLVNIASQYHSDLQIVWNSSEVEWKMRFRPLEIMIVLDNLVHNAHKPSSSASKITFEVSMTKKDRMEISVFDDGEGFENHLVKDIDRIFEFGVSSTDGSGMGLYHVRQALNEIGASIVAKPEFEDGAKFIIRFAR